jgi:hypothetical protein
MSQTPEPEIESSLLCRQTDGKQAFVHDTYKDFFAAKEVIRRLEDGSLDFASFHNMIGFKGRGSVSSNYQKSYHFLREMFGDDYNPATLDDILKDKKVAEIAKICEHYGLGRNSRLVIRIKDDSYCNHEGQMEIAKLAEHIHLKYGVRLIGVEGADGVVDTAWFKKFPDKEIRRETAKYFMKRGEINGIEFLDVSNDYPLLLYGCEDRELYIAEHKLKIKESEEKSDEEHNSEAKVHRQRESVLVENLITAMNTYNQRIAILVYGGGYMYDIDLAPMIKSGISYIMLNPKISGVNWELHSKILRGQRTSIIDILLNEDKDAEK